MAIIPITRGLVTLIDDDDLELVSRYSWCACPVKQRAQRFYAQTNIKRVTVRLHRLLMNPGVGFTVDHINGDGLDNRRCNLRVATRSQNNANKCTEGAAGYRGVWRVPCGRFRAGIARNKGQGANTVYLGTYDTAEEAAKAYDQAALDKFGEFARLNFPYQHRVPA